MREHYDVVVAGAGPAGAQCARDLAERGYDTVVLETESEAEFPRQSNKSTAGTFPSTMSGFNIPDEVVMNYTDEVVIESPNDSYGRTQSGAVLEFADFKRWLVAEGRENGAEYVFDARVTNPITENGEIVGVEYNRDEAVYGDVVVDATGPNAPLAKKLGVVDLERENQAIGIEYELEGIEIDHPDYPDLTDAMMLRLDHDLAPGGYSWIFHTGGDTAKVGICYIQNEAHREFGRDDFTVDDYLQYWLDTDPRFADAERIEGKQHRGSAHIQLPEGLSAANFMAVGDTVPTIDPLWGEGIGKGLKSGRAAAITVDNCKMADLDDTSAEAMSTYDRLWHETVAPNVRKRLHMTQLLYRGTNERYDKLVRDLNSIGGDTLQRANDGDIGAILRIIKPEDIPVVARYAKEQFFGE